jgi:hypothetical protein
LIAISSPDTGLIAISSPDTGLIAISSPDTGLIAISSPDTGLIAISSSVDQDPIQDTPGPRKGLIARGWREMRVVGSRSTP